MLRSMTGFASKNTILTTSSGEKIQISVSIKSLNSRFFETTFKMPHIASNLEVHLIKRLKKDLLRGHIYFVLNISNTAPFKSEIQPALSVCKGYAQAIHAIKKEIGLAGELAVQDIIQIPGAFLVEEREMDKDTQQILLHLIDDTVHQLIAEQHAEGVALLSDLQERATLLAQEMKLIALRSQEQIAEQKEKIARELAQVESGDDNTGDLRKNALYLVLDKIDIHEEIVRFGSHLKNLLTIFDAHDSVEKGKRIDFTLQELSREINTIAAKASDAVIGSLAVNIKVELEKAREQAQNIV